MGDGASEALAEVIEWGRDTTKPAPDTFLADPSVRPVIGALLGRRPVHWDVARRLSLRVLELELALREAQTDASRT